MELTEKLTITELIHALEDNGEPLTAEALYEVCDEEQRKHQAVRGLDDAIRRYYSDQRRYAAQGSGGSGRWDAVKAAEKSGELDILRLKVSVNGSYREVGELGVPELNEVVAEYDRQIDGLGTNRDKFIRLRRALKREKRGTVAELGSERVRVLWEKT